MPHLVVLFVCVSILAAALILSPGGPGESPLSIFSLPVPETCSFLDLTGLPCPGCGLTRSVVAAVRGDMAASWGFHRLGALTLFYILLQAAYRLGVLIIPRATAAVFGTGLWLNRGLIGLAILYGLNWMITLVRLL
jgi:hypothetical protein